MKTFTLFLGLVSLLALSTACSEEEEIRPDVSATRIDNNWALEPDPDDLDVTLELDAAFLLRKEELKLEYTARIQPNLAALAEAGKRDLARYNVDPAQLSQDPNDPRFAAVALLVGQLEDLYAQGYQIKFVDGPVDDNPEAFTGNDVKDCALQALGLKVIVEAVQSGAASAGLTGEILVGTFFRMSVRSAIGWVGAAYMAYEMGNCLAEKYEVKLPDNPEELLRQLNSTNPRERQKIRENLAWWMAKAHEEFQNAKGDTATVILKEAYPYTK